MAPKGLYLVQDTPESLDKPFTILSPANTDMWRKPPAHDVFDAPIVYEAIPLSSFRSARVTVTASWIEQYDQGGLFLNIPSRKEGVKPQWVKSGIEFFNGKPFASFVGTDRWSDWSLAPIDSGNTVTIEFERVTKDGIVSPSLWTYIVTPEGRLPIRESNWVFKDAEEEPDAELWVGAFAARPETKTTEKLEVSFSDFKLTTA